MVDIINFNETKGSNLSKNDISSSLIEIFTISIPLDLTDEEKKEFDELYNISRKIYIFNIKNPFNQFLVLLKKYIQSYKKTSNKVQESFQWKLEEILKYKKMNVLYKQIEQDGWLIQYWQRRLNIK